MTKKTSDTIGTTKAFRWFNEMQVWDRERFLKYLDSDYFQTRGSVLAIAESLKDVLRQPEMSKAAFYLKAVPKDSFSHSKFNERFNQLMEAMRHFVAVDQVIREMDQKADLQRVHFFKGIKEQSRNEPLHDKELMWKEYQSQYHRLAEKLNSTHQNYLLAEVEDHFCETYSEAYDQKKMGPEPQELIGRKMAAMDKAYYVERMKSCAILMDRRARKSFDYSPKWKKQLDRIRKMLKKNPATASILTDPQVIFYEEYLDLMRAWLKAELKGKKKFKFEPQVVENLCRIAGEHPAIFEEDPYAYGVYSNVLTFMANLGHERFSSLYFDLNYQLLLKGKILDNSRKIPVATFRNTVVLGYRLGGQYATLADHLVEKLRNDLSVVYNKRANLLKLCKAWKYFYRKEYAEVYRRCTEIEMEDPRLQMQIADLKFRAAFSAAIGMDPKITVHLDFLDLIGELKQVFAPMSNTKYAVVVRVKEKMPLYAILVQLVDGKTNLGHKAELRKEFRELLQHAPLPGHELTWLQEASDHID